MKDLNSTFVSRTCHAANGGSHYVNIKLDEATFMCKNKGVLLRGTHVTF